MNEALLKLCAELAQRQGTGVWNWIKDISGPVAALTLALALFQFWQNSRLRKTQSQTEAAVRAANEIDSFYEDRSVWVALRLLDYGHMEIKKNEHPTAAPLDVTKEMLASALTFHRQTGETAEAKLAGRV
jgi:hypothetical protein